MNSTFKKKFANQSYHDRVQVTYDDDLFAFNSPAKHLNPPQPQMTMKLPATMTKTTKNTFQINTNSRKRIAVDGAQQTIVAVPTAKKTAIITQNPFSNFKITAVASTRKVHQHPSVHSSSSNHPLKSAKKATESQCLDSESGFSELSNYNLTNCIGSGTYGQVFKGYNVKTKQTVAVKRIMNKQTSSNGGLSIDFILREVDNLKQTQSCMHVVAILEVFKQRVAMNCTQIDLIFEYCPHDLRQIIQNKKVVLELPDIKALLRQLFVGLEFIHSKKILHRDIKTENILLTNTGILKIADFGLSRKIADSTVPSMVPIKYSNNVVTLWYRAPEILLGDCQYTFSVDIWSAGCVMAEFWIRQPIIQGRNEYEQLKMISQLCGTINEFVWPNVINLPLFQTFDMPGPYKRKAREYFNEKSGSNHASNLFDSLLELNPDKRIDALTALNDDFFYFDPLPSNLKDLMVRVLRANF